MKTDDSVNKKNDLKASVVVVIGKSLSNQKPAIWQEYPCLTPRHAGLVDPKEGFGSLFHKQPAYLHEALLLEPAMVLPSEIGPSFVRDFLVELVRW